MENDLHLCPITGYSTATLPDQAVMLQVQFLTNPMQPDSSPNVLNFAMHAAQCLELGQALLRIAEKARNRTDSPGPMQ